MKTKINYIVIIYLLAVSVSVLSLPLETVIDKYGFSTGVESELQAKIITRPLLLIWLFLTIKKFKLSAFNGLGAKLPLKNMQALLIPMIIIVMGIFTNWYVYLNAEYKLLILFILSVLAIGFFEEFLFRGIILPLFIKAFDKHKHAIYLGVFSSAVLFGVTHYLNLLKEPDNFWGVTSQVVFATAMGIFFAGLLFRTRNIFVPAIFHAMVNFSFGPSILKKESGLLPPDEVYTLLSWLPSIFFLFFIAFGGVYMIKRTKKEEIMSFLGKVKI